MVTTTTTFPIPPSPPQLADPLDACTPFPNPDLHTHWVALISREQRHKSMDCTFDVKVGRSQRAASCPWRRHSGCFLSWQFAQGSLPTAPRSAQYAVQGRALPQQQELPARGH